MGKKRIRLKSWNVAVVYLAAVQQLLHTVHSKYGTMERNVFVYQTVVERILLMFEALLVKALNL